MTAARIAAASAWLYSGVYAKILQGDPRQRDSVADLLGEENAEAATLAVGAAEAGLAAWALSGRAPRSCATAQTAALLGLAAARLGGAPGRSGDPERVILGAAGRAALAWVAARG